MPSSIPYAPFPPFADWADVPVELRYWREAKLELEEFREKASAAQIEEAARFVTRATAVDTSAIEGIYTVDRGFTLSVAAEAGAWEHEFEEKGQEARQHFEAQLRASELVLDAATRRLPVVEALIRALHEQVCAAQETYRVWTSHGWQDQGLVRGEYKGLPNNPLRKDGREHAYAPVERVQEEMQRLVTELGSEAFDQAPAPVQAAYAHYAFVSIHPFADGNGRVARALASIYLVRATSVPFLLFADQKAGYLDALEAADEGAYRPLSSRCAIVRSPP
jgi:Fic family protein